MAKIAQMWARIWAIALNTFREAVRNKVLAILVLFAVALMAFSLVLGQLSLHEEVRIIKDLGLAGISLFGVVIALFLGVNLLSKELDRKTVYAIIPKPLHRWEFLLGKYLGLLTILVAQVVALGVIWALVAVVIANWSGGPVAVLALAAVGALALAALALRNAWR